MRFFDCAEDEDEGTVRWCRRLPPALLLLRNSSAEEEVAKGLTVARERPSAVRLRLVDEGCEGGIDEGPVGVLLREVEPGVGVRGTVTVRRMTSALGRDLGTHGFCLVNIVRKRLGRKNDV